MRFARKAGRTAVAVSIAGLVGGAAGLSPADASTTAAESTDIGQFCNYDLETQKSTCYRNATLHGKEFRGGKKYILALWGQPNGEGHGVGFTGRGCSPGDGRVYVISDLRKVHTDLPKGQDWNNRASSLKAYNGCKAKLFGRKDQQGRKTGWLKKEGRLGTVPGGWNNRATSISINDCPVDRHRKRTIVQGWSYSISTDVRCRMVML